MLDHSLAPSYDVSTGSGHLDRIHALKSLINFRYLAIDAIARSPNKTAFSPSGYHCLHVSNFVARASDSNFERPNTRYAYLGHCAFHDCFDSQIDTSFASHSRY